MTRSFVKECLICSRKGEEFVFNRNVETGEIKAYLNRYAVVPLETLDTMTNPYKNYIVISFGRLRLKIGRWYIVFSNHRCINFEKFPKFYIHKKLERTQKETTS